MQNAQQHNSTNPIERTSASAPKSGGSFKLCRTPNNVETTKKTFAFAVIDGGVYCNLLERENNIEIDSSEEKKAEELGLTTYQWQCSSKANHNEFRPPYASTDANTKLIQDELKSEKERKAAQMNNLPHKQENEEEEVVNMEKFCKIVAMKMSKTHPRSDSRIVSNHIIVNRIRLANKTLPLHRVGALDDIALEHAKLMESQGHCYHSDANSLIATYFSSMPFRRIGENVCCGKSLEWIEDEMMQNPDLKGYRNNILDRRFSSFGVGVAISTKGQGTLYICQIFVG